MSYPIPEEALAAHTAVLGKTGGANLFAAATNLVPLDPRATATVGGSQAHINMQPFLAVTFCIAVNGIFPSQN